MLPCVPGTGRYEASRRVDLVGTFATEPERQWAEENVWLAVMSEGSYLMYSSAAELERGTWQVDGRIVTLQPDGDSRHGLFYDDVLYLFDPDAGVLEYARIDRLPIIRSF